MKTLQQKQIFIVYIYTGDFHNGESMEYKVSASSTREARRIGVEIMELEGMGKRQNIRRTIVQPSETIYTL